MSDAAKIECAEELLSILKANTTAEELPPLKRDAITQTPAEWGNSTTPKVPNWKTGVNHALIPFDPNAFLVKTKRSGMVERSPIAAKKAKSDTILAVEKALTKNRTQPQQLLALHGFFQRPTGLPLLRSLQSGTDLGIDIVMNIKELLAISTRNGSTTNDSRTLLKTLMLLIAPTTGPEGKMPSGQDVIKLSKALNLPRKSFMREMKIAITKRDIIMNAPPTTKPKLVQTFKRKSHSIYTADLYHGIEDWLFNHCDMIKPLNDQRRYITVKDLFTHETSKKQVYLYSGSFREIHNLLTADVDKGGFAGARDANGKSLISDTMLRTWKPPNLKKMTGSHMEYCVCPICFILKQLQKSLHVEESTLRVTLEQKYQRERNVQLKQRLKKKLDKLKDEVFPNGEHRFPHVRDAIRACTCAPVVGEVFKLTCALERCDHCPPFPTATIQNDVSENAPSIQYEINKKHSYCTEHGTLEGAPSKCQRCEEIKADEKRKKKEPTGTCIRKPRLTTRYTKIGKFMNEIYIPHIQKYRYHDILKIWLGKNYAVKQRKEGYKKIEGAVSVTMDYSEGLDQNITKQAPSEHFGDQPLVSMEAHAVRFMVNKGGPEKEEEFHYCCFLSDEKRQDSRTSFDHLNKLIPWLRRVGQLPEGSTLYVMTDGCGKQYRCGNTLFLVSCLAVKFKSNISWMVQCPYHGKGESDHLAGTDKNYARQFMQRKAEIETWEDEDGMLRSKSIMANVVGNDDKMISSAERMCTILSAPERKTGMKGGPKHAKREANAKLTERHYWVCHYGTTDSVANSMLPIKGTSFVATGFESGRGLKHKGIGATFFFYYDYHLGLGRLAARRLPCDCPPCHDQLQLPWDDSILDPLLQPKFQVCGNCHHREFFGDCNPWMLLTLVKGKETVQEEIEEVYNDVLGEHEAVMSQNIRPNTFGAYECDTAEKFYLVKWIGEPYALKEDSEAVEGCSLLLADSIVCKGVYWNAVRGAKQWYTPPTIQNVRIFRVRYVVATDLLMLDPSNDNTLPNGYRRKAQVLELHPKKLAHISLQIIQTEIAVRSRLDFDEDKDDSDIDSDEEDDENDSESSDENDDD